MCATYPEFAFVLFWITKRFHPMEHRPGNAPGNNSFANCAVHLLRHGACAEILQLRNDSKTDKTTTIVRVKGQAIAATTF